MSATTADRVRASRLRRKASPTDDERAWLADYEARKGRATVSRETVAPPVSRETEREPFRVLDFGAEPEPAPPKPPATELAPPEHAQDGCPVGPDCPRCRARQGGIVCTSTGDVVWPKMTVEGARGMARALLTGIAVLARMFGRDVSPPSDVEVNQVGDALREVIYRRASAAGAGDDVWALAFALGAFGARVWRAPKLAATGAR